MQKVVALSASKYLSGIATGNRHIISRIKEDYLERICSFIENNGGNNEDGEDIFQDALMSIYVKVKSSELTDLDCSFYTYLFAICKNLWYKKCRRTNRETHFSNDTEPAESGHNIVEAIELKERWDIYRENFGNLGSECQDILQQHFGKKTFSEIGEEKGLSSNYVKKKKHLCKKTLLSMIAKDSRFKEFNYGYQRG